MCVRRACCARVVKTAINGMVSATTLMTTVGAKKVYIMKRFLFVLAAIALISCDNNEPLPGLQERIRQMTVIASTADASTRTALQKDGDYNVVWTAGDKIEIGGQEFALAGGEGTTEGEFTGPLLDDGTYDAYYGISSKDVPLESTQTYMAGKISNAPMYARVTVTAGKTDVINFQNTGGLLRLVIKNAQSVKLRKLEITGDYFPEYHPSTSIDHGYVAIHFSAGDEDGGIELKPQGTLLYIAMREGDYRGLKIEMTGVDGSACTKSLSSDRTLSITRSLITNAEFTTLFHSKYCGHEYADLGLPSGTFWATCNLDASSPGESGSYYSWGDSRTCDSPSRWSNYKFSDGGTENEINKYTYPARENGDWMRTLLSADDAANCKWGGGWRMPTKRDFEEIDEFCYWVWTNNYNNIGAKGYIVYKAKAKSDQGVKVGASGVVSSRYSLADSHIFLPVGGKCDDSGLVSDGSGYYWSASLSLDNSGNAESLAITEESVASVKYCRYLGFTVRPVWRETVTPLKPEMELSFVDLGFPNVLWAADNIGATSEDPYGVYFPWADPFLTGFSEINYRYGEYVNEGERISTPVWTMTKYNGSDFGVLQKEDDAAYVKTAGKCRMPTENELNELVDSKNCEWIWDRRSYYGIPVFGYTIYSNIKGYKHNSIFLPACGHRNGDTFYEKGQICSYWSSTLRWGGIHPWYAATLCNNVVTDAWRYEGRCVRAVRDK